MKIKKIILALFSFPTAICVCFAGQIPADISGSCNVALAKTLNQELPSQLCRDVMKGAIEKSVPRVADNLSMRHQTFGTPSASFRNSFKEFIKRVYNHENYVHVLSQDGSDLSQFLDLTSEASLGAQDAYVGLRLFTNKIKACEVVDDGVVEDVLAGIIKNLSRYFVDDKKVGQEFGSLEFIKKHVENTILMHFTSHLQEFQQCPSDFTSHLSDEIAVELHKQWQISQKKVFSEKPEDRLRIMINKFLELSISKLLWNIEQPSQIWPTFLSIANKLKLLGLYKIITHMDDLDDLLWTLTQRFCFFLDWVGQTLPVGLYDQIEHDLVTQSIDFLEMREQDAGITTKKEILANALLKGRMRALAFERKGL